jgi:hypothetical protein
VVVSKGIYLAFALITNVTMLNLIIAMMGHTYAQVRAVREPLESR